MPTWLTPPRPNSRPSPTRGGGTFYPNPCSCAHFFFWDVARGIFRGHHATPGEAKPSKLLVCNGRALRIQPNLYDFLIRLRQQRRGLPLWIDAVCINQDESDEQARREKYRQIRLMHKVYSSAASILVWLGESAGISSTLPRTLEEIPEFRYQYQNILEEGHLLDFRHKVSGMEILVGVLGLEEGFWTIVRNVYRRFHVLDAVQLAKRNYFHRVWVVQELVLAREVAFMAGPLLIPWDLIRKAHPIVATLHNQSGSRWGDFQLREAGFLGITHIIKAKEILRNGLSFSLEEYLFLVRERLATCPEDKVFSILGLIDEQIAEELTKGVMDNTGRAHLDTLYLNCAVFIAREKGWPYVLSLAGSGCSELRDLPSFVFDLRKPLRPKPFWYLGCAHHAAATAPELIFPGDFSLLMATGVTEVGRSLSPALEAPLAVFDVVVQVGESSSEIDPRQVNRMQGHFLNLLTRLGQRYAPTGELTLDALRRTPTADFFAQNDAKKSPAALRAEFGIWLGTTFDSAETRVPGTNFLYDAYCRKQGMDTRRDTPAVNGKTLDLAACIDDFVRVHDSSVYPVAAHFNREPSSRLPILQPSTRHDYQVLTAELPDLTTGSVWERVQRMSSTAARGVDSAIGIVYKNRRIFRSGRGYLGCTSKDVRLGDVVCLVAGAPTPFVFRRLGGQGGLGFTEQSRSTYMPLSSDLGRVRLVGAAYVHGIMNGEFASGSGASFAQVQVV